MRIHPIPASAGHLELSARQAAVTVHTCIVDAHGVRLAIRPSVAVEQILTGGVSHAIAGLSAELGVDYSLNDPADAPAPWGPD